MGVTLARVKDGSVRKLAAIILAVAVVGGMAACSDLPAQVQGCTPVYTAGAASKSITATGAVGVATKVKVPTPLIASKVETSTLVRGKGLELGAGDIARISLSLYLGATGASEGATSYKKSAEPLVTVGVKQATAFPEVLAKALQCQTVGSRVATVMTAAQYLGSKAAATADQVPPTTVLVGVFDIVKGYRGRATGTLQPLQGGFPSVVTSGNGTPGVTLDLQEPPKTLQSEVVRRGSGAKIKAGEKVLLQVQGIEWSNPAPTSTFDSTWTPNEAPRVYTLTADVANTTGNSLDPGSVKALTGQTIGSQILVVVPAKYGYPTGKAPSGYPTKSTLIFVYDILGTY
jgi:hypothetical protein